MTINRDARLLYSGRVQYDAFLRAVNTVASSQATRIAADEVSIAMGGVVLLEGAQTVNGAKTFTSTLSAPSVVEGGTALGSKYAAIGHDHAGVYQPVDGDLTAIAALAGPSGLARKTAADTWELDTNVYLTSYTETDPVFTASPAAGISALDITAWDTAFGWGNHALAGYLTSFTETDPVFTASPAAGIAALDITNWNTAFGWGNHALAGYLTSFTETDPVFLASAAAGIAGADITNWNAAFGWGNHALAGYLTSFTETDPVFAASAAAGIAGADITNWNLAFGWGDHAGLYEPTFSKNTAFNKNFGSAIDTVCQGNDARLSDARTPLAHTHVVSEITDFNPADYLPLAGGTLSGSLTQGAGGWVTKAGSSGDNAARELLNFYDDRTDRYASIGTWRGAASTRIGLSFWGSFDAAPVERVRIDDSGNLRVLGGDLHISGTMQSGTVPWARLSGIPATFTPSAHTHVKADITDFAHTHPIADVTGRAILTRGTGLTGNNYDVGTATTWAVAYGTAAGTACVGNDARLSDARTPLAHTHVKANITDFAHTHVEADITDLQAYALDSVVVKLTGNQTVAGVKTFSSAPRVHRTDPEMLELWHTDASANTGRWRFDVAADGKLTLQGFTDAGVAGQLALDIPRSAGNVPAVNLYANGVVNLATQQFNTGDATSGAVVRHRNGGFYDVGMNAMPITDLTGADLTLGPQHCGGLIRKWDTVARNINIPASTDTTIPIGARFEYAGWNPGVVTLVGGAGVSISWLTGAGTTIGNRTFANGSQVTIVRTDAARWFIWGVGIS